MSVVGILVAFFLVAVVIVALSMGLMVLISGVLTFIGWSRPS
jgi:hypothetical protein